MQGSSVGVRWSFRKQHIKREINKQNIFSICWLTPSTGSFSTDFSNRCAQISISTAQRDGCCNNFLRRETKILITHQTKAEKQRDSSCFRDFFTRKVMLGRCWSLRIYYVNTMQTKDTICKRQASSIFSVSNELQSFSENSSSWSEDIHSHL